MSWETYSFFHITPVQSWYDLRLRTDIAPWVMELTAFEEIMNCKNPYVSFGWENTMFADLPVNYCGC